MKKTLIFVPNFIKYAKKINYYICCPKLYLYNKCWAIWKENAQLTLYRPKNTYFTFGNIKTNLNIFWNLCSFSWLRKNISMSFCKYYSKKLWFNVILVFFKIHNFFFYQIGQKYFFPNETLFEGSVHIISD